MQIAQVLAGYTLAAPTCAAPWARKRRRRWPNRARSSAPVRSHAVSTRARRPIFDLMEKFAGYGFNKSHSAAYALVSYQTLGSRRIIRPPSWPPVLSSDMDNTDKVVTFIEECRSMKLKVEPPDVNRSSYMFTVDGDDGRLAWVR